MSDLTLEELDDWWETIGQCPGSIDRARRIYAAARRWLEHTGGPGMEWSVEEQQHVRQASSDEYADTGFDAGVKCLECGAHPPEPHDRTCQRSIFNKRKRPTSDDVLAQLENLAPGWDAPFDGLFSRAAARIRKLSNELDCVRAERDRAQRACEQIALNQREEQDDQR